MTDEAMESRMPDIPRTGAVLEAVPTDLSEAYRHRLRKNQTIRGMGRVVPFVYWSLGGSHVLTVRRYGRFLGLGIRVFDDLLDGDLGPRPIEDRDGFIERFIQSFEECEPADPAEMREELVAYHVAAELGTTVAPSPDVHAELAGILREMKPGTVNEDRSTLPAYQDFLDVAGDRLGEFLGVALEIMPDFRLGETERSFVQGVARAGTLIDHLVDGDVDFDRAVLADQYRQQMHELQGYGYTRFNIGIRLLQMHRPTTLIILDRIAMAMGRFR